MPRKTGVEKGLDTARTSACATSTPGIGLATIAHSDGDDRDLAARSADKPSNVIRVAGENYRSLANGYRHNDGVNHVRRSGPTQQTPCFVSLALAKRNDRAPGQEAPELGLLWRPADLGDDGRGNQRNNAKLQTRLMFRPSPPIVPVRRHEYGSVVDDRAHAGRRTFRGVCSCARTLRRASIISSALNDPRRFSHSATAAKPARRCSASRAALVIQADMLTRSRSAAARIFA